MRSLSDLRLYQHYAINYLLDIPYCALFLGMGLGKTIISLTVVNLLLQRKKTKVLIAAPLLAAEFTWPVEIAAFEHLKNLTYSVVTGTEKERLAALQVNADVYIINHDNIVWLVKKFKKHWPFKIMVIDESSYYKNHQAKKFRAIRFVRPFLERLILLTGTPAGNSYLDLWAQFYLLDHGQRLEDTITKFRTKYFDIEARNNYDLYTLKKGDPLFLGENFYEAMLFSKIRDICISMETREYLELPPVTVIPTHLDLKDKLKEYRKFKREKLMENPEISGDVAAVMAGKLKQYATGEIYDETKKVHTIHRYKLDALKELIESARGEPVLIFYWFQHEKNRILKEFKHLRICQLQKKTDLSDWNTGKFDIMLLQPRSAGHGLNLQKGGHIIIWYSLPYYSQEIFRQANARLDRSGQEKPVLIYILLINETVEMDEYQVILGKMTKEQALLNAVRADF
jgi:SNF2 family DNA or RNA helicase